MKFLLVSKSYIVSLIFSFVFFIPCYSNNFGSFLPEKKININAGVSYSRGTYFLSQWSKSLLGVVFAASYDYRGANHSQTYFGLELGYNNTMQNYLTNSYLNTFKLALTTQYYMLKDLSFRIKLGLGYLNYNNFYIDSSFLGESKFRAQDLYSPYFGVSLQYDFNQYLNSSISFNEYGLLGLGVHNIAFTVGYTFPF